MTTSVVVIAHNEEQWIDGCLQSLESQTKKPDEIIVVLHHCTDNTKSITTQFPFVKIIETIEDGGPIIARIRGIEAATSDIVCCIDGDCWATNTWIEKISVPLQTSSISIVAGYTSIQNNIFWKISSWWQFYINRKILRIKKHSFAWGSNMAFRKNDYKAAGGLRPFLSLYKKLDIKHWAEDLYLSHVLQKNGKIYIATNARVYTYLPREKTSLRNAKKISQEQSEDNRRIREYLHT